MELLDHLAIGMATALTLENLLFCFAGVLVGTLVGVLPGLGPTASIAMLLPLTYALPPEASLIMLAGIFYGSQYGGSTTAILINLPGETSSSVTAIDGYQLARQGKAGKALAIAAIGSFFAGTVATFIIAGFAIPLTLVALQFKAAEYFALIVLGLVTSVALAHGSVLKGIAMVILGLLLGLVGTDVTSGARRFTFGSLELSDGLSFVAVSVGVFGIAEILRNLESRDSGTEPMRPITSIWPSFADIKEAFPAILRGTGLGSALGILPGGGSILAAFSAYALEKKVAKDPSRFGHGAIEGVAAPESANNAGAQTSFIPLLTLGIPGNPITAMLMGAMIIQGIVPGPGVAENHPQLFWGIIVSMWTANLMLIVLNLPLVGIWVQFLKIPYKYLVPIIIGFATIGVYSVSNSAHDVLTMVGFGLLGYLMVKLQFQPAPLLLGFVLGSMCEEYLRRAMLLSRGDPVIFLTSPISVVLLAAAALVLIASVLPAFSKKREVFAEED